MTRFLSRAAAGLLLFALSAACDKITQLGPTQPERNWPDLSGTYTLTLSASTRCSLELPEAVRTRTYTATVTQARGSLNVTLPSIFPPWSNVLGTGNSFTGDIGENNDVTFHLQFEEWLLQESVTDFIAYGTVKATISADGLSGLWDGWMRAVLPKADASGNHIVTCTAPEHGVQFSR